jgi:hypothetical protein
MPESVLHQAAVAAAHAAKFSMPFSLVHEQDIEGGNKMGMLIPRHAPLYGRDLQVVRVRNLRQIVICQMLRNQGL